MNLHRLPAPGILLSAQASGWRSVSCCYGVLGSRRPGYGMHCLGPEQALSSGIGATGIFSRCPMRTGSSLCWEPSCLWSSYLFVYSFPAQKYSYRKERHMTDNPKIQRLREMKAHSRLGGGEERIEAQHKKGRMTARCLYKTPHT